MRTRTSYARCLFVFVICVAAAISAEDRRDVIQSLRGEVIVPDEGSGTPQLLTIELSEGNGRPVSHTAPVTPTGQFDFRHIEAGLYRVRIMDMYGAVMQEDFVSIQPAMGMLQIRLREAAKRNRPASGVVAASTLAIPPKAFREFMRAEKSFREAKIHDSVRHLERAIALFPDYAEARNNLGARFYALRQYDKALAEFEAAAKLNPSLAPARSNMAVALAALGKLDDAEWWAREGVRLDAFSAKTRYVLGIVLLMRNQCGAETLDNLQHASAEQPRARLLADELLKRRLPSGECGRSASALNGR